MTKFLQWKTGTNTRGGGGSTVSFYFSNLSVYAAKYIISDKSMLWRRYKLKACMTSCERIKNFELSAGAYYTAVLMPLAGGYKIMLGICII